MAHPHDRKMSVRAGYFELLAQAIESSLYVMAQPGVRDDLREQARADLTNLAQVLHKMADGEGAA